MPTNTTSSRVYRYCFDGCEGASLDAALITDSAFNKPRHQSRLVLMILT